MSNNKSLIVAENGLIYKIRLFFNNLFNRNNKRKRDIKNNEITDNASERTNFKNNIKIEPDIEREQLLKLQKDYESGLINEENMTEEQVSKIEKLYIEQISKLRDDYIIYKEKATELKKKTVTNN